MLFMFILNEVDWFIFKLQIKFMANIKENKFFYVRYLVLILFGVFGSSKKVKFTLDVLNYYFANMFYFQVLMIYFKISTLKIKVPFLGFLFCYCSNLMNINKIGSNQRFLSINTHFNLLSDKLSKRMFIKEILRLKRFFPSITSKVSKFFYNAISLVYIRKNFIFLVKKLLTLIDESIMITKVVDFFLLPLKLETSCIQLEEDCFY